MPGLPLVAFRPDADLHDALCTYAEELGMQPSVAARTLLEAALSVEKGQNPKSAALRAAVKAAVWKISAKGRVALQDALDEAKRKLLESFDVDDE
jgi:hypothetical protein